MEAETEAMNGENFFHPVIVNYECGKKISYNYNILHPEKPDYSAGNLLPANETHVKSFCPWMTC